MTSGRCALFLTMYMTTALAVTLDDCERWAKEGECTKVMNAFIIILYNNLNLPQNPRYLWANCLQSCMTHSKDDNQLCSRWSAEGECTKNPTYGD